VCGSTGGRLLALRAWNRVRIVVRVEPDCEPKISCQPQELACVRVRIRGRVR